MRYVRKTGIKFMTAKKAKKIENGKISYRPSRANASNFIHIYQEKVDLSAPKKHDAFSLSYFSNFHRTQFCSLPSCSVPC
jgi:hypothetical protein